MFKIKSNFRASKILSPYIRLSRYFNVVMQSSYSLAESSSKATQKTRCIADSIKRSIDFYCDKLHRTGCKCS